MVGDLEFVISTVPPGHALFYISVQNHKLLVATAEAKQMAQQIIKINITSLGLPAFHGHLTSFLHERATALCS